MSFPPNDLRLTPDVKKRSVSMPSHTSKKPTTKNTQSKSSYIRLTADNNKRSISIQSRSAKKPTNDDAVSTENLSIPPKVLAYMKTKEEAVASQVEQGVLSAFAELTKVHMEAEKQYRAEIKELREQLVEGKKEQAELMKESAELMEERVELMEKLKAYEAKAAGH